MRYAWVAGLAVAVACGGHHNDEASGWVEVTSAPKTTTAYDVWAFAKNDVRIAAAQGQILRWDGASWTTEATGSAADVTGLWALGPDDVFACAGTEILHYDGSGWSVVVDVSQQGLSSLSSIWASSATDVYVVGFDAIVVHWDGTTATRTVIDSNDNSSVFGTGPDDIWVVGTFGIDHFDGTMWSPVDAPELGGGNGDVWGSAPDDIWIATESSTLGHFDGTSIETIELDNLIGEVGALWGPGDGTVWGVGNFGLIARYDGSTWHEVEAQAIGSPQLRQLFAVHGSSPDDIWAVGQVLDQSGGHAIIHHHPG